MPHDVPALAQAHAASNRAFGGGLDGLLCKSEPGYSLDLRCALELVAGSQAPKSRPNGACLPLFEVKGKVHANLDHHQKSHQPGWEANERPQKRPEDDGHVQNDDSPVGCHQQIRRAHSPVFAPVKKIRDEGKPMAQE